MFPGQFRAGNRLLASQCSVVAEERTLSFQFPAPSAPDLAKLITGVAPDESIAFMTGLDPMAKCCLVWKPGQQGITAIAGAPDLGAGEWAWMEKTNGLRIAGWFLGIAAGIDWSGGKGIEDGCFVGLREVDWKKVSHALKEGAEIAVEASSTRRATV